MGEAKRRGTFEERKAAAVERDAEARKKRKLAEITRRRNMTLEEKKKEQKVINFLTILEGISGASVLKFNNPLNSERPKPD